jgi:hypothetical protein
MENKEQRINQITKLYYSRKDVQKALFSFSPKREIAPSYRMETFGKRPDSFQYPGDVFELVKKGATSFHCSQELWKDPLKLSSDLSEKQLDELREGWDLLLDVDSKYLDYSKIMAELIIEVLKFHRVKNFGIKFSGSKGFHILVPWKAFPKVIHNTKVSNKFPEWPRIITKYIMEMTKKKLIDRVTELTKPSKYIKDFSASQEVMPDLILVSSRHLFRMPYSLHEKTALASIVLTLEELKNFQPKHADPLKVEIRNFMPEAEEGEGAELLREALDWYNTKHPEASETEKLKREFKPIKLENISEKNFPPSIIQILQGVKRDGKKRALFILMNFLRSLGMEKEYVEKILYDWNKKNEPMLKEGYIKIQLIGSYRKKPIPPPNFDKDYYRAIGIVPTEEEIRYKNPVSFTFKKTLNENNSRRRKKTKNPKTKDNFKNKK